MKQNSLFPVIYRLAKSREDILFVTADNGFPDFNSFRKIFPNKFLNFGISESNMISFSAGMSSCGKTVFAFAITTFLTMRAYEQIRNDICLSGRNVKLVGIGAGLYYSKLGNSHHAIEDIALFCVVPNITVVCPYNTEEMIEAVKWASNVKGPVYIRYNINLHEKQLLKDYQFEPAKGLHVQNGEDITLISTGDILDEVVAAVRLLETYSVEIIHIHTVKPIDRNIIKQSAKKTRKVVTIEEHNIIGGLGAQVADVLLSDCNFYVNFMKIGIEDSFPTGYGELQDLREEHGLTGDKIASRVKKFLVEGDKKWKS